jgi:hypothetical protein
MTLLVMMKFWLQTISILVRLHRTYLTNGVLIKVGNVSRASEASCSPSVSVALLRSDLRSLQRDNVKTVNSRNTCYHSVCKPLSPCLHSKMLKI